MALLPWVRLPSAWIDAGGLKQLRWMKGAGSNNTAALMTLIPIAHHADRETGVAKLTYDQLCIATGLSRAKLSDGLDVLAELAVIQRGLNGRSTYQLANFDPNGGWAMLPARRLYSADKISAFSDFSLRRIAELNALKLYFLFVARRGRDTNVANIGYDKITEYTGVERNRIPSAIGLLNSHGLAYTERVPSMRYAGGVSNAYRLVGLDSYNHMGTRGRGRDAAEFEHPADTFTSLEDVF